MKNLIDKVIRHWILLEQMAIKTPFYSQGSTQSAAITINCLDTGWIPLSYQGWIPPLISKRTREIHTVNPGRLSAEKVPL